jgi:outer membrane protein TolC
MGLVLLSSRSAFAIQALEEFLTGARGRGSVEIAEAREISNQRTLEARAAWAKLAPSLTAQGSYTRNQRAAETTIPATPAGPAQTITITPLDQLDASIALNVPIIDVGNWQRIGAAEAIASAAKVRAEATGLDVDKVVTRAFYQVVAADASMGAAKRALDAANDNLAVVSQRLGAGTASELDTERAKAEVERARQTMASAQMSYAVAKRSLQTASGVTPADGGMPSLEDSLVEEGPLASLEPSVERLPSVRAAKLETRAAEKNASAAWGALVPTVTGTAVERFSNATGFGGSVASWALSLNAQWTLDASVYFTARAQSAATSVAVARERRATLTARDEIHNAWQQVRTQIATARAARAQLDASNKTAKLVRERYKVGAATQLEVTLADRDALSADMARIQALADLAYARALLRIDTGRSAIAKEAR